jgi:hypothetical protein
MQPRDLPVQEGPESIPETVTDCAGPGLKALVTDDVQHRQAHGARHWVAADVLKHSLPVLKDL